MLGPRSLLSHHLFTVIGATSSLTFGIREVSKLLLHLRVLQAAEDTPALVAEPKFSS